MVLSSFIDSNFERGWMISASPPSPGLGSWRLVPAKVGTFMFW